MSERGRASVDYGVERTALGTWRRHVYPGGRRFAEFKSHAALLGLPRLRVTYGIRLGTGRRVVAKGVFAIGRVAMGAVAIGQVAIGARLGAGQQAVGQLAYGHYVLAQRGAGEHAWSLGRRDGEVVRHFRALRRRWLDGGP